MTWIEIDEDTILCLETGTKIYIKHGIIGYVYHESLTGIEILHNSINLDIIKEFNSIKERLRVKK